LEETFPGLAEQLVFLLGSLLFPPILPSTAWRVGGYATLPAIVHISSFFNASHENRLLVKLEKTETGIIELALIRSLAVTSQNNLFNY
jgi:hypothetical protein